MIIRVLSLLFVNVLYIGLEGCMRKKKLVGTLITVLTMGYSIPYSYAVHETTYNEGIDNKISAYTQNSTIVGYKNNVNSAGLNSDNDVNVVNHAAVYGSENSVEFDSDQDISQAIAIGHKNIITKFNDTAVGTENELKGNSSVAVGVSNKSASGADNAILVGTGNSTALSAAVMMGNSNTTSLANSVMVGNGNSINSTSKSEYLLAVFGNNNTINDSGSAVAIGHGVKVNSANSGIGIGSGANVSGQSAIALGLNAEAKGFGISIGGWDTKANDHSLAMGHTAHALGYDNIALGTNASANKSSNIAIGNKATANVVDNAVALGSNSVANRKFIANATVTNDASVGNNSVYGFGFAKAEDLDAIRNTVQGNLGAMSIGHENGSRQIINVAAGTEDSDAVNVAQLKAVANSITNTVVEAGDNVTIKPEVKGNTTTYTISADVSKKDVDDLQKKISSNGDRITELENKPIVDSDTITTVAAGDNSVVVIDDKKHNYTIKVSDTLQNDVKKNKKDIDTISETVKENILKIDSNSKQIKENTLKIENNNNRIIQNAANIENHRQAISAVNARVNHLDSKINKVGAGAAALAGLHPLDFDPDDKWTFSAGYGNYNNADAVAIGSFYRPNEDTMFSVAGSIGNGENMVNASVSLKFGQKSTVTNTRVAIAKDLEDLKAIVKAQHKQIESLQQQLNGFTGQAHTNKEIFFEDVPEQHWAYEYVKTLADKGLLIGYPDGTFKGEKL